MSQQRLFNKGLVPGRDHTSALTQDRLPHPRLLLSTMKVGILEGNLGSKEEKFDWNPRFTTSTVSEIVRSRNFLRYLV